ncbi:LTA synthase family protein [Neptuniibacter sp.]|uniref:LTA synthase family protein n=1 Tax=Neptuniibacter sp. TaxID=1962643 RepID=UPI00261011EA|nr:LTA synthase family protein [Neptuniibacter sp.]
MALIANTFVSVEADSWLETNPTMLSFLYIANDDSAAIYVADETFDAVSADIFSNQLQLSGGEKKDRNVLIVVLEGIPGAYVSSVRDYFGVETKELMPNLSKIAELGQVTPSFIAHSQQTIRGLYSILCGDYSKQSRSTVKALEYLQIPANERPACLPQILKEEGYQTSYMQAAALAFMSKDQFMPAVGFDQVKGKDINQKQYVDFGWGPDDRAFLEAASEHIADLNSLDKPWLLTLLTVGTHHPYAAPEKLVEEYGTPKEAAVAYLDQAVGAFMTRLAEMGVPEDTLIIFTSDESHGVAGHPYGNNWGLNIALGPDVKPGLKQGLYGLSDTALSVLDYLGVADKSGHLLGRSLFREYEQPRSMLFHSTQKFKAEDGQHVLACNHRRKCSAIGNETGLLFAPHYTTSRLQGEDNDKVLSEISLLGRRADQSLNGRLSNENMEIVLQKNSRHDLSKHSDMELISGGNLISLPDKRKVKVTLRLLAHSDTALKLRNSGHIRLTATPFPTEFDRFKLPELKAGDLLELDYSFYSNKGIQYFSPFLEAGSDGEVEILEFKVSAEPAEEHDSLGFSVDKLNVTANNKVTDHLHNSAGPKFVFKELVLHSFTGKDQGKNTLIAGWGIPESWGVWSVADQAVLRFAVDNQALPLKNYSIKLKLQGFTANQKKEQKVSFKLNGVMISEQVHRINHRAQVLDLRLPEGVLQNGSNLLQVNIEDPVSPLQLGIDTDSRALGLGLKAMQVVAYSDDLVELQ